MYIEFLNLLSDKMKRSRLNLFKVTSMSISVLGILLILATLVIFAYIGISALTTSVSTGVDSGSSYDQIAVLQTGYNNLNEELLNIKPSVDVSSNNNTQFNYYVNVELQLVKTQNAINSAQSALSSGQPSSVVQSRIAAAQNQLEIAKSNFSTLQQMVR